jgi:hypothetical protein
VTEVNSVSGAMVWSRQTSALSRRGRGTCLRDEDEVELAVDVLGPEEL